MSILLSDIVTLEERGIWQGYANMVFACGAGLGAPLGEILTDAIGWRWAFIVQGPLCAIAIVFVSLLLKLPPRVPEGAGSIRAKLSQVDFLGAATPITSLVTLLVFLDHISSADASWISYIYALASGLAFSAFLYVEQQIASRPLTPLRLLFDKDFLGAYLALAFGNVGWYGVIFYVHLLYHATGHFSPSAAGTLFLPGISSAIIGGFVGGAMVKRKGGAGFRDLALASYPLVTVACAGVAACAGLFWADQVSMLLTVLAMSLSLFVGGLGNGGGMTATLVVRVPSVRRRPTSPVR